MGSSVRVGGESFISIMERQAPRIVDGMVKSDRDLQRLYNGAHSDREDTCSSPARSPRQRSPVSPVRNHNRSVFPTNDSAVDKENGGGRRSPISPTIVTVDSPVGTPVRSTPSVPSPRASTRSPHCQQQQQQQQQAHQQGGQILLHHPTPQHVPPHPIHHPGVPHHHIAKPSFMINDILSDKHPVRGRVSPSHHLTRPAPIQPLHTDILSSSLGSNNENNNTIHAKLGLTEAGLAEMERRGEKRRLMSDGGDDDSTHGDDEDLGSEDENESG